MSIINFFNKIKNRIKAENKESRKNFSENWQKTSKDFHEASESLHEASEAWRHDVPFGDKLSIIIIIGGSLAVIIIAILGVWLAVKIIHSL